MNIPDHLRYSAGHLWAQADQDGLWLAGITDYAQDLLGDIVYVEAPAPGTQIEAGKACGLVESVKTGSDLHAPLSGVVEAVNTDLQNTPEQINDAPYKAWIFKFRPDDSAEAARLMDSTAYSSFLGNQ
ncbi:glycine cleavage system H protein [Methylophilaceae bacterium]|nr:glycine cleavage system H protein [Methylophilaceae bacterium]